MKTQIIFTLALSLLISTSVATAQTLEIADHVVINEIDINPTGDDSKSVNEWIEIYNPTSSSVDLSGWEIASTTVLQKTMTLPLGTIIEPGQFRTYSYQPIWFTDVAESVELRDESGNVVDKTPIITDELNDFTSWQRVYDALDSNSDTDWTFEFPSVGGTNGSIESIVVDDPVTISIETDKSAYLFGDIATFSGTVSEEIFVEKPTFAPEQIVITISGENYSKTITQYPGSDLLFSTDLNLQKVLGVNQGTYDVSVEYAGASAKTQFSVGDEIIEIIEQEVSSLSIHTDRASYLPGDTVTLSGMTNDEISFEGLKFTVTDSNGSVIANGDLFPNTNSNKQGVRGGDLTADSNAQFTTSFFVNTVNPAFGKYHIIAQYATQSAETTFEVIEDIRDETIVTLQTDKQVYIPGEIVTISGRSNIYWVPSLSLEVIQSSNLALGTNDIGSGGTAMKVLDVVRLEGDSSFQYEIPIPSNFENFGEFRVTVSGEIGTFITKFAITDDASNFSFSDSPFEFSSDKDVYNIGDVVTISGSVLTQERRSSFETISVNLEITDADGESLSIIGLPEGSKTRIRDGIEALVYFTAIPDPSGNFETQIELTRSIFNEGVYTIDGTYGGLESSTSIIISDPANVGDKNIIAILDKEIYGLGETVYLTGSFGAQTRDSQGINLTVHKPDGDTDKSGAVIDSGIFSWEWELPSSEKSITKVDDRSSSSSNFGIYKINLETEGIRNDIFFKVSADPENDSLNIEPLTVSTSQNVYKPGDKLKVIGDVITRVQGTQGLVVPDRVAIKVISGTFPFPVIHEANVMPEQGGGYQSLFELPATIFLEGEYKVVSTYLDNRAETTFFVDSDFTFGGDEDVSLILTLDKDEYNPGDTLILTGKPSKIIYVDEFDVSVIQQSDDTITCGSFYCGVHAGLPTSIRPNASAGFTYSYDIPSDGMGSYEITVDAEFETKSISFNVVEKSTKTPTKLIDKFNRISESKIVISPESKSDANSDLIPRVISGSLLTPSRAEVSNVNLQITSPSGICIIGQSSECLVSDSTRTQGSIYSIVDIDGINYKVRYSGPDATFEKFSILPESDDTAIVLDSFDVSVIKDAQPSKFYYKITYVPTK